MAKAYGVARLEKRIPMEMVVRISGHGEHPGMETTFTENVSSRGARVVTIRRWQTGEHLTFASLPGDFRTTARVAYCQSLRGRGFAIGVEFLEPAGRWVINPQPAWENR